MNRISIYSVWPLSAALIAFAPIRLLSGRVRNAEGIAAKPTAVKAVHALSANAPVVQAANEFLASLTAEQKAVAQQDLARAAATRWSNFPIGMVPRNGVAFGTLNPTQTKLALDLAHLALGDEGFARLAEIRAADDVLGKAEGRGGRRGGFGGPPGGGFGGPPPGGGFRGPRGGGPGANEYSAGNYYVAFLGKPSTETPWLLQIGGHHLAFNLYYRGTVSYATPYFIGVEPQTWTDAAGKTHGPLAPMRDAMFDLVNSLTPEQRNTAHLRQRFGDVLVGPGRDGQFPEQQGVPVSSLSPASQALVKKAIIAWTQDSAKAAEYQKRYFSELAKTTVAYSGTTTFENHGDYVRIDGPHVWIEFACQNGIVMNGIHFHTIWRDRTTDYGASFDF